MFCVYKVTNSINKKIYIGKTNNILERTKAHKKACTNSHFHNAIKKYGFNNFIFEIIFQDESESIVFEKEIELIAFFKSRDPGIGYNKAIGGEGASGWKHTPEAIEKIRKSSTGRKHTCPEYLKAYFSKLYKGKKQIRKNPPKKRIYTKEQIQKMATRMKGKNNPFYGKKHSKEFKEKQAERARLNFTGKKLSEEHKQKLSKAKKGYVPSEASKLKRFNSLTQQYKVISPTNEIFIIKSLNKFCTDNKLNSGHMFQVAKGKLKSYKKWKVEYYNDR